MVATKHRILLSNMTNGTTYNATTKVMLASGTDTNFSPYNPNPIELCKIGNYKDTIKKSTGKNLLDRANAEENKGLVWATGLAFNETNSITSNFMETEKGKEYIFNYNGGIFFYDNNKNYLGCLQSGGTTIAQTNGTSVNSFKVPNISEIKYMRITFRTGLNNYANLVTANITINSGTIAQPYEPYGNVWYIEKNIGKVVLNGSETITAGITSITGKYRYHIPVADIKPTSSATEMPSILCDRYVAEVMGSAGIWNGHEGISVENSSTNHNIVIFDNTYNAQDTTAYKTWLSNNNTTVYYVLSTPQYIVLNEYQQAQLEQLQDIILQPNLCYIDWFNSEKPNMYLKYNYLYISENQTLNVKKGAYDYTYPVTLSSGYELDEGDSITYTTEWKHNNTTITDNDLLAQLNTLLNIDLYNNSNVFTFSKPATLTVEFIPTTVTYTIASSDEPLFVFKKGITYTVNPGDYTIDFYTKIGSSLVRISVIDNTILLTKNFNIYKITVTLPTYTAISNKLQRWRLYEGTESDNTYTITLGSLTLGNGDKIHKVNGKWMFNTTEITDTTLLGDLKAIENIRLLDGEMNYINWHGTGKVTLTIMYYYKEAL